MKKHIATLISLLIIITGCAKTHIDPVTEDTKTPILVFDNEQTETITAKCEMQIPFSYHNMTEMEFIISNDSPLIMSCEKEEGRGTLKINILESPDNGTLCHINALYENKIIAKKTLIITKETPYIIHEIKINKTETADNIEYVEWDSSNEIAHDISLTLAWSEAQSQHYDEAFIEKGTSSGVFILGQKDPVESRENKKPDLSSFNGASENSFESYLDNMIILPDGKTAKIYEKEATHIYKLTY